MLPLAGLQYLTWSMPPQHLEEVPWRAGLIGEVVSGRADIAVSQLTASATRLGYVDQSAAFVDSPMGLLAHASTERPVGMPLAVKILKSQFMMAKVLEVSAKLLLCHPYKSTIAQKGCPFHVTGISRQR